MPTRRSVIASLLALLVGPRPAAAAPYEPAIIDAAARHGTDPAIMTSLMLCESEGNPHAIGQPNPDGSGPDTGLFQYSPATWSEMTGYMGMPHLDIWNPDHQIEVTAWALANGYGCRWVCMGCGNF